MCVLANEGSLVKRTSRFGTVDFSFLTLSSLPGLVLPGVCRPLVVVTGVSLPLASSTGVAAPEGPEADSGFIVELLPFLPAAALLLAFVSLVPPLHDPVVAAKADPTALFSAWLSRTGTRAERGVRGVWPIERGVMLERGVISGGTMLGTPSSLKEYFPTEGCDADGVPNVEWPCTRSIRLASTSLIIDTSICRPSRVYVFPRRALPGGEAFPLPSPLPTAAPRCCGGLVVPLALPSAAALLGCTIETLPPSACFVAVATCFAAASCLIDADCFAAAGGFVADFASVACFAAAAAAAAFCSSVSGVALLLSAVQPT